MLNIQRLLQQNGQRASLALLLLWWNERESEGLAALQIVVFASLLFANVQTLSPHLFSYVTFEQ